MKVLGIVVEYNPFHNGHMYHLERAKEIVEPDYTVAVMSGNFTQRGEPAIVDKFARTEIALRCGVDLVVELPFVYATQDAGGFALGAIGVFHKMKLVTDIVFGSESADEEFIRTVAEILHDQPELFKDLMRKHLKEGHSFPNARKYALMDYVERTGILDKERIRNIEKSNDILGIEYVRSILRYRSKIEFHTVKRIGAEYTDESFKGRYSSATAIRKLIRDGKWGEVKEAVPRWSFEVLRREIESGRGPVFWEDLEMVYLSRFRLMGREDFERIHGFNEGLDVRFERCSRSSGSLKEFVECVKAKRFTFSRIRRLALHSFFDVSKDLIERSNDEGPQYIRVLGFNERGRELLSKMKKISEIPIISTPSLYRKILEELDEDRHVVDERLYLDQFELDVKATNVHSLFFKSDDQRRGERDFKMKVVIV